eukprot:g5331.t1
MSTSCRRVSNRGRLILRGRRHRSRCFSISSGRHQVPAPSVDAPDFTIRVVAEKELWAVADVHSAAFYPETNFVFDPLMKLDRVLTLVEAKEHTAQKLPTKCVCLVAKKKSSTSTSSSKKLNAIIEIVLKNIFPSNVCDGVGLSRSDMGIYGAVNIDTIGYNLPSRVIIENGRRSFIKETGCAYLSNLAVAPEARNRKVGSTLVQACEFVAKKWGCWAIALHCDPRNTAAFNLYKKLGYVFPDRTNKEFRYLSKAHVRFDGTRLMAKLL